MARKMPPQHTRSGGASEPPDDDKAGNQAIAAGAAAAPPEGHCSEQATYAVGKYRPPLHSRFKPGQSGNPKGRAKQSRNLRTIVNQVLSEDMQIREGGRLRRMCAMEALVRTLLARSFKGDPKALASLIMLLRQSGLTERDENVTELLHGPNYDAIIADFLARNGAENAASDDELSTTVSPTATSVKQEV
jgi:Family of unknown function (DUF5681)